MQGPPLERIRAQHFALRQQMRALEQLFEERNGAGDSRVRKTLALLEGFDPALRDHFAVEERGGYFSEVLQVAPRLNRRAERLQQNHLEFRQRLNRLLELTRDAVGAPDKWERVTVGVAEFLQQLSVHEDAENELVREAFMHDLGQGD